MRPTELNKRSSQPARYRVFATLNLILFIAYPIAAHISAFYRYPFALWVVLLLFVTQALQAWLQRRHRAVMICLMISVLLLWLLQRQALEPILLMTPLLIIGGLLLVFAGTLIGDSTPLITRFAEQTEPGPLTPAIRRYTRRVTQVWVALFIVLMLESILLALFAPVWVWSLFTNVLNYVFVFLLLFVELHLRRRYAPDAQVRTFRQFLLSLTRIDWRQLAHTGKRE